MAEPCIYCGNTGQFDNYCKGCCMKCGNEFGIFLKTHGLFEFIKLMTKKIKDKTISVALDADQAAVQADSYREEALADKGVLIDAIRAQLTLPKYPCCEGVRRVERIPGDQTSLMGGYCPVHGLTWHIK